MYIKIREEEYCINFTQLFSNEKKIDGNEYSNCDEIENYINTNEHKRIGAPELIYFSNHNVLKKISIFKYLRS
jgi:hypothetical protein